MNLGNTLTSNVIAGISLLVSAITCFYYFNDRRREKYHIVSDYLKQLMDWHADTVSIRTDLRSCVKNSQLNKPDLLSRLSSQIEKGRFYFPNIDKHDGFGEEKPAAYQGYRNLTLDFLVYSYNLFAKKNADHYLKHAEVLQREFTSIVFQVVRPKENLSEIKRLTDKFYASEKIFEDYLEKDPDKLHFMYRRE